MEVHSELANHLQPLSVVQEPILLLRDVQVEVFIVHYVVLLTHELQDSELHAVGLIYDSELACERYFRLLPELLNELLHALYYVRLPCFFVCVHIPIFVSFNIFFLFIIAYLNC